MKFVFVMIFFSTFEISQSVLLFFYCRKIEYETVFLGGLELLDSEREVENQ